MLQQVINSSPNPLEVQKRMTQQGNEIRRNVALVKNTNSLRRIPDNGDLIGESSSSGVKVYKAWVDGKLRAIKKIDTESYGSNYKKEVEMLAKSIMADCKYLVRYFSHEEEARFWYIEMELCIGSLSTYVQKKQLYQEFGDDIQKRRIFQKNIIEGIAYLHDNVDLIHRDIKPCNVLIALDGHVLIPKIADYGISEIGEGGKTQLLRGTAGWTAPEITTHHNATKAVDIFAVGCLLYYIETNGKHPFCAENPANFEKEAQMNINEFKPIIQSLSSIEPTLLDLICRTLEREPEKRITANKMLSHPVFLPNERALYLLRGVAEKGLKVTETLFDPCDGAFLSVIINNDWRECLEDEVIIEASLNSERKRISKFKNENYGKSVYHLLALIREKYARFQLVSKEAKAIMGDPPNRYFEYWHERFPHLFVNTWKATEGLFKASNLVLEVQNHISSQFNNPYPVKEKKNISAILKRRQVTEKTNFLTYILSFLPGRRTPGEQKINLSDTSSFERGVEQLSLDEKKSYFNFLTDYPAQYSMAKQLRARHDTEALKREIVHRLRHRIDLSVADEEEFTDEDEHQQSKKPIYEALLDVLKDFDPCPVSEIFRLLIEARFTVPIFNPLSRNHYLPLFREIYVNIVSNESTNLGDDTKLPRLVLMSRRKPDESQTLELLNKLFSISSLHLNDLFDNCFARQNLTIDLGIGYLARGLNETKSHHVLVAHVIGDFEEAADFVEEFADVLLVEDTPSAEENSPLLSLITSAMSQRPNMSEIKMILWKPKSSGRDVTSGMEQNEKMHGFAHLSVYAQYGDKLLKILGTALREYLKPCRSQRKRLSKLTALNSRSSPITYETVDVAEVLGDRKVGETRATLVLQRFFRDQATYEESKRESHLDHTELAAVDEKIDEAMRKRCEHAPAVSELPLIKFFLGLLNNRNQSVRVMALRQLEQCLDRLTELELNSLQSEINYYYGQLQSNDAIEKTIETKQKYVEVQMKYRESMLYIEHLWRELSHMYVADPQKFQDLPKLAAQHLMDGFSVELLDGEAGSMNLTWIEAVFFNLGKLMKAKRRIFVLSVMGVQSSGKSTLLNTMFGIRMRTSVGQCTRGINMQLVPVEGRREYDYVLILDTEGTRSPEHWGVPGNEKRDNQMATLSILLADATIIVNPGENDAAVKEILPVVLMAYQSSKLAEDTCGRLSSMMFFVYNRIDTTQRERLTNIIQGLSNFLTDAMETVQRITNSESCGSNETTLFRHFVLEASKSVESDVRILGQNKRSFVPPDNVPDPAYGEALVEFREHIHKRVTKPRDGVKWQSHSPEELSEYLEDIWECICSADFNLQFADVVERANFDQLEAEYQKIECKLAKEYNQKFSGLRKPTMSEVPTRKQWTRPNVKPMANDPKLAASDLKLKFQANIRKVLVSLDKQVKELIGKKANEKWQQYYEQRWELCKTRQSDFWMRQLHYTHDSAFQFTKQVDDLKSMMRKAIEERFSGQDKPPSKQQFDELIEEFINYAQANYPTIDIKKYINDFYSKSATIRSHQIDVFNVNVEKTTKEIMKKLLLSKANGNDVRDIITNLIATLIQTKLENGGTTYSQLASCLIQMYHYILRNLNGVEYYDQAFVLDTIERTDHFLRNSALVRVENSHRQLAHTFARMHLIFEMDKIQKKWEATNSVGAKLKQSRTLDEMWNYFVEVSRGAEKTKLFATVVRESFSNLQRVYKTELAARTVAKLKDRKMANLLSRAQSQVEHYLIEHLRNSQFRDVLQSIRNPCGLMQMGMRHNISRTAHFIWLQEKPWNIFISDLKGAIDYATNAALKSRNGRAQNYLNSLRARLQKSLANETIALLLLNTKAAVNVDNERDEDFRTECQKNVMAFINHQPIPPQDWEELKNRVIDSVEEKLHQQNAMTTMRCDHCCPWCWSVCTRRYGHDPSKIKHDALHQPIGLIGKEFGDQKMLDVRSCCDIPPHEICFTGNSALFFYFRDWSKMFPDWEKPRANQRNRLGEYIFYRYHHELAKHYKLNPSPYIPRSYNHDLNVIESKLERPLKN